MFFLIVKIDLASGNLLHLLWVVNCCRCTCKVSFARIFSETYEHLNRQPEMHVISFNDSNKTHHDQIMITSLSSSILSHHYVINISITKRLLYITVIWRSFWYYLSTMISLLSEFDKCLLSKTNILIPYVSWIFTNLHWNNTILK